MNLQLLLYDRMIDRVLSIKTAIPTTVRKGQGRALRKSTQTENKTKQKRPKGSGAPTNMKDQEGLLPFPFRV